MTFLQSSDDLSYPQRAKKCGSFVNWSSQGILPIILGLAYAKACAGKGIALKPVQRQGAGYHSEEKEVAYASATSLRLHKKEDQDFVARFILNSQLSVGSTGILEEYDNFIR